MYLILSIGHNMDVVDYRRDRFATADALAENILSAGQSAIVLVYGLDRGVYLLIGEKVRPDTILHRPNVNRAAANWMAENGCDNYSMDDE